VLGYEACNLCLIGRIPYFLVITFSLIFFFFKKIKKIVLVLISISFVFSVLISFYHFGIEQGFFHESLICQIKELKQDMSANELLQELENNRSKSCKDVSFRIFGLSLATINLFISLILSIITFKNIFKNEKNK
jgi:disulfide bond formation protein DsbB